MPVHLQLFTQFLCLVSLLEPLRCFPSLHFRGAVHSKTSFLKGPNLSYAFAGLSGMGFFLKVCILPSQFVFRLSSFALLSVIALNKLERAHKESIFSVITFLTC